MNKLALGTLALGLCVAAPSAFAQAQCPPGSWLCADITIGGAPGPVDPPVIVAPPPPPPRVILVPRPRIWVAPPPPVRVYVPPPPVVVYQQQQPTWVGPQPQYLMPPPRPRGYVGVQVTAGGSYLGDGRAMGALGAGLRFRGAGHLGAELAIGYSVGTDFNGDRRTEIPVTGNALFFFNPQNRLQFYALVGVGASFADVQYRMPRGALAGANYTYLGATGGLGAELQISPRFSLFADVRGFVRGRVDAGANSNAEFSRTTATGTETTNTSGGIAGQVGAVLYF